MKTLLILAALTAPGAADDARHFETTTAYELGHLDAGGSACADLLGPQLRYEDTVGATSCFWAIQDYFLNIRGNPGPDVASQKCAARLILQRSNEQKTVKDILDAEFDNACQPATM